MTKRKSLFFGFWLLFSGLFPSGMTAQKTSQKVFKTFKDTRVINAHSTEMLPKYVLDFRIGHRFGDIGGPGGGWETFYGLENASDITIGFEYGISRNFMIGINRSKGAGPLRQNINGIAKVRLAEQDIQGGLPFSLAVLGLISGSTMPKSTIPGSISFFEKPEHRFAYHLEAIIARKFSNYFSLQFSGAWTYRNIVPANDQNDLASVGMAMKIQLTKPIGILLDGKYVFSEFREKQGGFYIPFGVGIEWETGGGHVFQVNFTNSRGIIQTDYIPYSNADWAKGEFRLGFSISRQFRI